MATVCIDERPIPGQTNEVGTVYQTTEELIAADRHTDLFEVITADAGNSSLAHASLIHRHNLGYVLSIEEPSGEIHREALRLLEGLGPDCAEHAETRREKGARVTHRVLRASLSGYLQWTHARQLVRVESTDREVSVGNRHFVTNLVPGRLDGKGWLTLLRMHWRCENEGHWTADGVWMEDARRTPWIRVPHAVYALSVMRMLALNVLAVLRRLSRRDYTSKPVPWRGVARLAHFALAGPAILLGERLLLD